MDYQQELMKNNTIPLRIVSEIRMLYNPELKGATNFVPGIMALVLLLVCVLMTAVSIVREKETGTMEVLLVSPIQSFFGYHFKSHSLFFLSLNQPFRNTCIKRYPFRNADKWQSLVVNSRKYFAYYLCFVIGFADF
jgi:hypothetical protein